MANADVTSRRHFALCSLAAGSICFCYLTGGGALLELPTSW